MYYEFLKLHKPNLNIGRGGGGSGGHFRHRFSGKKLQCRKFRQIIRVNSDRNGGKYGHGRQLSRCFCDTVVILN